MSHFVNVPCRGCAKEDSGSRFRNHILKKAVNSIDKPDGGRELRGTRQRAVLYRAT